VVVELELELEWAPLEEQLEAPLFEWVREFLE
jgi:hypothetical protein